MAHQDRPGHTSLHEAITRSLAGGALLAAASFVVAGAANLGFYDAFGLQDIRLVGVDKSAIVDHAIVLTVVLFPVVGFLVGLTIAVAAIARGPVTPWKERGPWTTLVQAVLVLAVLAATVGFFVWLVRTNPVAVAATVVLLVMGWLTVRYADGMRKCVVGHPWRFLAACGATTAVVAMAAFFQGAAWGRSVRDLKRTRPPSLAVVLIVQWPHGALLDGGGPEPAAVMCTDEILLGRAGGTYVLYNARVGVTHEAPTAQRLTRTSLAAVRRSGCPGPASPASAR